MSCLCPDISTDVEPGTQKVIVTQWTAPLSSAGLQRPQLQVTMVTFGLPLLFGHVCSDCLLSPLIRRAARDTSLQARQKTTRQKSPQSLVTLKRTRVATSNLGGDNKRREEQQKPDRATSIFHQHLTAGTASGMTTHGPEETLNYRLTAGTQNGSHETSHRQVGGKHKV